MPDNRTFQWRVSLPVDITEVHLRLQQNILSTSRKSLFSDNAWGEGFFDLLKGKLCNRLAALELASIGSKRSYKNSMQNAKFTDVSRPPLRQQDGADTIAKRQKHLVYEV